MVIEELVKKNQSFTMKELLQLHPPTAAGFSATWRDTASIKKKNQNERFEKGYEHMYKTCCLNILSCLHFEKRRQHVRNHLTHDG